MRTRILCILGLAATCGGAVFAQDTGHAVTIVGTITYQVPNETPAKTKSIAYNNAAILSGVLAASGTAGIGLTVKDLDIAIDDSTHELDVVIKATGDEFYGLAATGSDTVVLGQLEVEGKKSIVDSEIQHDYIAKVIVGETAELAACGLTTHTTITGTNITAIDGSFIGGTGPDASIQGQLSGSFKTSKKTYVLTTGTE